MKLIFSKNYLLLCSFDARHVPNFNVGQRWHDEKVFGMRAYFLPSPASRAEGDRAYRDTEAALRLRQRQRRHVSATDTPRVYNGTLHHVVHGTTGTQSTTSGHPTLQFRKTHSDRRKLLGSNWFEKKFESGGKSFINQQYFSRNATGNVSKANTFSRSRRKDWQNSKYYDDYITRSSIKPSFGSKSSGKAKHARLSHDVWKAISIQRKPFLSKLPHHSYPKSAALHTPTYPKSLGLENVRKVRQTRRADPALLLNPVAQEDHGLYRCRLDYWQSPTTMSYTGLYVASKCPNFVMII